MSAVLPLREPAAAPAAAAQAASAERQLPSASLRLVMAAVLLWALLGAPGTKMLESALPLQRTVLAALLPEFDILVLKLERRGAQWKLQSSTVNRRYIVMQGRAVRPGLVFDVETPARTPLLFAALILAGSAWVVPISRGGALRALLLALPAAAVAVLASVPIILAGQQWGLGVSALQEPSLPALWVALSEFLLHGGGFALCAAVVWMVAGRRR